MTAGDVMDLAASALNDSGHNIFTYANMLPYLQLAYTEMGEILESNNIPMTNEVSSIFVITTAMTDIGGSTGPSLPTDLIEIQGCYERLSGSSEDFIEMTKVEFLPPYTELTESLIFWAWQKQIINFLGATTARDVRLNYIGNTLTTIVDNTSTINLFNCKSFLAYRTASLCAKYVGENPTRSQQLDSDASMALDRLLNISTKGRQATPARRRPFLGRYKVTGGW